MAGYSIITQRVDSASSHTLRWHLDFPSNSQSIDGSELAQDGLLFQGWLLNEGKSAASLVILNGDEVHSIPINRTRPDVVSRVLKQEPENHDLLHCGFSERIYLKHSTFTLGLIQDGKFTELMNGSVEGKFQILEGKDGWLFLDNDTNKSIEQYTGKLKLSRTAQAEWKEYLVSLNDFSRSCGTPVCLLVAPSKEMVYEEYYPYRFSKKAPIQKLKELIPESLNFILPIEELRNLEQRSFRVCDTHWTLHGARLAAQLVASKLSSLSISDLNVFSNDTYQIRKSWGDLGSKVYPPQQHEEDSITNFNYRRCVVFDNNVDNFGRIIVMFHQHAVSDKTLLLFGSSSSYTMFHYLCRLYTSVVFIHTAGNVDHKIIDVVKPDCICVQTNARFVVKAPKFNDSVVNYIEQKKQTGRLETAFTAEVLPDESVRYIRYFKEMLV
ncbi:hypothetical protein AMBAS45_17090 [Alteromonas macleodii str. 'Balearic Sea AD45']|uniref:alginate O-acetyltransferase AlgX-related protein n=1 Tax=Alteromonas macleodii TaxID=28108 RepID=UPI000286F89E|nr:hypothetical protein [Alteromonas macleodii]AFT96877.1 hypothetical protein AMBAS45_17090 [Alteromonas macleodii str. 'Balearic Sea AD45']